MHTKKIGSIGELAIANDLMSKDYYVFTELGDLSRVDLVALKDQTCYRIQCKAIKSKNKELVEVPFRSGTPQYSFKYQKEDFDILAVYVYDMNKVLYVASNYMDECSRQLSIRFIKPKNGQTKGVRLEQDYTLEKALDALT